MRWGKLFLVFTVAVSVGAAGCSDKGDRASSNATTSVSKTPLTDEQQIQEVLSEIITRWHYGDKAGLYDNEFEYVRDKMTFDDYLKLPELRLDADTVKGINVLHADIWGKDSADAKVEIIFEGPTGKISKANDVYRLYYDHGRWIRPTVGALKAQREYEQIQQSAESAAAVEEDSD